MMSIEEINAQREAIAAQLEKVNSEIAKAAKTEARKVASVAGLGVKFYSVNKHGGVHPLTGVAPIPWSQEEDALLFALYQQIGPAKMKRDHLPNRSYPAIVTRARGHGLCLRRL